MSGKCFGWKRFTRMSEFQNGKDVQNVGQSSNMLDDALLVNR